MSIMQSAIRGRAGPPLTVSISGPTSQSCGYTPPATSCISNSAQTATASGGSGSYTYAWTVISGAGVTFTASTSSTTTVRRSAGSGEVIVVRCTVNDGITSAFAEQTITTLHTNLGS